VAPIASGSTSTSTSRTARAVERLYEQKLGDMTEKDVVKEGAASLDEFKEHWVDLYGP
jgi:hypothetical protein